jgi:hypothetical protein
MKEVILTPIKVVESKKDSNLNAIYKFVTENFEALLIGAQRRSEHENTTFAEQDKITCRKVEFHFTRDPHCLVKIYYNGDEVTSYDHLISNSILGVIDSLRVYAEHPDYYGDIKQSIIYDNGIKPNHHEDIF